MHEWGAPFGAQKCVEATKGQAVPDGQHAGCSRFNNVVLQLCTELGQDFAVIEREKTCLVWPDLVEPDVRISSLGCLHNCRNMTCGIGTADDRLSDLLLSDGVGGLGKMGRESKVREECSLHASDGPT